MTEAKGATQLPQHEESPQCTQKARHESEPEALAPRTWKSQETWARAIVLTLNARRLNLFSEEETEGQSDPHACARERSCQCSSHFTRVIDKAMWFREGLTPVSRHGLVPFPQCHPCSCTQVLQGGSAHLEDFSRVRVLCCSQVQARTGNDTGRNPPRGTVLNASHVGLFNPTTTL